MATTTQPLLPTFSERSTGCYNNWGYMWTGKFNLNTDIRVNVEIFKSGKRGVLMGVRITGDTCGRANSI